MNKQDNTPVPVTAEDREAAASVIRAYRGERDRQWAKRVESGAADDGAIVQAFAHHRLTARTEAEAEVARLREFQAAVEIGRRREVQMIGAAISLRSWHDVETAYNQLRDRIDRAMIDIKRTALTGSADSEGGARG